MVIIIVRIDYYHIKVTILVHMVWGLGAIMADSGDDVQHRANPIIDVIISQSINQSINQSIKIY